MNTQPFWSWFTANEKKLRSINKLPDNDRDELLHWFSKHLHYISPKIGHRVIIPYEKQGVPTIAFSSSKDPEVRALILNLMETAPKFENWIITALINSLAEEDPDYFESEYCLNGVCCKPSGIKFWGLSVNPKTEQFILGIILDFPINKLDPILLYQIVSTILNDTLGEETYERYIEDFIIHSQIPEEEELFELPELKQYLEDL